MKLGIQFTFFCNISIDTLAVIEIKDINDNVVFSDFASVSNQQISNTDPWKNGLGFDTTISVVLNTKYFSSFLYFLDFIPIVIKIFYFFKI